MREYGCGEAAGVEGSVRSPPDPEQAPYLEAYDGRLCERQGTAKLVFACGNQVLEHEFEVIGGEEPFLLGADLYSAFGIYLGGLPVDWPGGRAGEGAVARARKLEDPFRLAPKPWGVECEIEPKEREWLLNEIAGELAANEQLATQEAACEGIIRSRGGSHAYTVVGAEQLEASVPSARGGSRSCARDGGAVGEAGVH